MQYSVPLLLISENSTIQWMPWHASSDRNTMWKVIWIELTQIPFLNFPKCSQCVIFFLVAYTQDVLRVKGRCYQSMKNSEPPHTLEADITTASKILKGRCSCVAGAGGFYYHIIVLLFYLSHCKQSGLKAISDGLTCTSLPQRWSIPCERKIQNKVIQNIWVKKPQLGTNYSN